VREGGEHDEMGLVPSFAKNPEEYSSFRGGPSTFNARVEGVETSGLWRRLVDNKRAVVVFDGFYEWKTAGKSKTPMFIRNRDEYDGHTIPSAAVKEGKELLPEEDLEATSGPRHAPLLLAALYDVWRPPGAPTQCEPGAENEDLESTTILTMDPQNTPMEKVHDRMPVFLTPETAQLWLDASVSFKEVISKVLKTAHEHAKIQLLLYEVSPLVSNIKNDSPDCILPKKQYDSKKLSSGLGRFFKKATEPATGSSDLAETQPTASDANKSQKRPLPIQGGEPMQGCSEDDDRGGKAIRID